MNPKPLKSRRLLMLMTLLCAIVSMTSCGTKRPEDDSVVGNESRKILKKDPKQPDWVAEDAPVTVWRKDANGKLTKVNSTVPKGTYIVQDPGPKTPVVDPVKPAPPVSLPQSPN